MSVLNEVLTPISEDDTPIRSDSMIAISATEELSLNDSSIDITAEEFLKEEERIRLEISLNHSEQEEIQLLAQRIKEQLEYIETH